MIQHLKRQLFLKLLLDSYAIQLAPQIWKKLPLGDQESPSNKIGCSITDPLKANIDFLKKIHYTWLANYIAHLPQNYQRTAANAFPDFPKIMRSLNRPSIEIESQMAVNPYIYHLMIEKIGLQERLPVCFLPASPFERLLTWDRNKILSLIDLLPLADASREIKQIVDRNKLMMIYAALTEEQKTYIKQCMVVKHTTCDLNINLKNWLGTKDRLKIHLHKQGLELFYKGLYQEGPDFLFYLSHRLDIGRGKPLEAAVAAGKNEEKKDLYYKNLIQCYKFISSYEKS
jgi:hypothetical protein